MKTVGVSVLVDSDAAIRFSHCLGVSFGLKSIAKTGMPNSLAVRRMNGSHVVEAAVSTTTSSLVQRTQAVRKASNHGL